MYPLVCISTHQLPATEGVMLVSLSFPEDPLASGFQSALPCISELPSCSSVAVLDAGNTCLLVLDNPRLSHMVVALTPYEPITLLIPPVFTAPAPTPLHGLPVGHPQKHSHVCYLTVLYQRRGQAQMCWGRDGLRERIKEKRPENVAAQGRAL